MGRDKKTAKGRLDKYYHMAKEQGYRSRAAFKLIQLNQKFNFLAQSRCVLDLCAAPGGWMQVAQKYCPVSSLIIGVDLAPIKPVRNCIALQEDITTEKCRQSIKRELKTWKVDCVLHDGAPNVGTAWVQDAYTQVELALRALQLATEMLREGGWFVTKVFRSKDYFALMWVLNQLFRKVHATKPASSRNVSAEIFVVCQGYKAPASIDPRLLDPKHVFQDVSKTQDPGEALLKNKSKKKAAAEGYADGVELLYVRRPVSDFVLATDGLAFLASASELSMGSDDPNAAHWLRHRATTPEIQELIKDIKVLGKKELRVLLKWREALRESWMAATKSDHPEPSTGQKDDDESDEEEISEGEREQLELEDEVAAAEREARRSEKAKRRKEYKQKLKTQERLALRMDLPGDRFDTQEDQSLFNLRQMTSAAGLDRVRDVPADALLGNSEDEWSSDDGEGDEGELEDMGEDDLDDEEARYKRQRERELDAMFAMHKKKKSVGVEDDSASAAAALSARPKTAKSDNPLLVSFDDQSASTRAKMWFAQDDFKGMMDEEQSGESDTESGTARGSVKRRANQGANGAQSSKRARGDAEDDTGFEVVPEQAVESSDDGDTDDDTEDEGDVTADKPELDAHGLALGTLMLNKRKKRDLIDDAYNRHAFNDDILPEWFADHESKYRTGPIKEVPKDMLDYYRQQMKELNARPIKKIAEAKARKKMKLLRKMEQMKKKMESVLSNGDVSDSAKARELERLMARKNKKAQRREVKYVVAKKNANRGRPAGVKGPYKMVDGRMKKDARAMKRAQQRSSGKRKR